MITERLLDRSTVPAVDDFLAAVGPDLAPLWSELAAFITQTYAIEPEIRYGGKKNGWFLKFIKGGRPLCDFSPTETGFTVLIVLGKAEADQALACQEMLGEHARGVLLGAHAYHDGRWLFIPVQGPADLPDIQRLLLIKRKPPRKKTDG
jgi:hypothetical protein